MGADVKILGTDLTGATSVSLNGTAAVFTVVSPSLITTIVPAGGDHRQGRGGHPQRHAFHLRALPGAPIDSAPRAGDSVITRRRATHFTSLEREFPMALRATKGDEDTLLGAGNLARPASLRCVFNGAGVRRFGAMRSDCDHLTGTHYAAKS